MVQFRLWNVIASILFISIGLALFRAMQRLGPDWHLQMFLTGMCAIGVGVGVLFNRWVLGGIGGVVLGLVWLLLFFMTGVRLFVP